MTISKFKLTNQKGGGAAGAPTDAQYVTMALNGTLTNERVLTAGEGMDLTDGGAGGAATTKFETGVVYQKELYRGTLAAAGNFDVQNISQAYDHLLIKSILRSSEVVTADLVNIYLNNDTTATNYYTREVEDSGTSYDLSVSYAPGASAAAGDFSSFELYIPMYASAVYMKNIVIRICARFAANTAYSMTQLINWENTAAINRITIQPNGYAVDNFVIGSFLQLIGIKTAA